MSSIINVHGPTSTACQANQELSEEFYISLEKTLKSIQNESICTLRAQL